MFLIGSTLLFCAHLPFLDRAERTRKEILTGGTAPPWYGPAWEGTMLAQEAPLIEQGAVQFILFGVTVIVIFIALWITIAK